jgi:hypothetical protein
VCITSKHKDPETFKQMYNLYNKNSYEETTALLDGLEWVMPQRVVELLASERSQVGSRCNIEVWKTAPLCLM